MRLNRIVQGDCLALLDRVPAGSVDLLFADPPFNIGYQYDQYDDERQRDEYLAWTERWLAGAKRVLSPTGSMFVAIGDEFVAEHKIRMDALGLTMRNWIVWYYTFGVNCKQKFSRSHTHILYYVADPRSHTFNADSVRVPSARQTTYSDARANPKGKVPDNTWIVRPQDSQWLFASDEDTWLESRVCGTFHERRREPGSDETAHPCQMPEAVLERIIKAASHPGQLVLDPFAGSGTTLAVAARLGRKWLGFEVSKAYQKQASLRVAEAVADRAAKLQSAEIVG